MPRPQTKSDLLHTAQERYAKLGDMIAILTPDEQEAPFTFVPTFKDKEAHWTRDKNLRDVLAHLYEWQQLLLRWVSANQSSEAPVSFLPAPYNWSNYGAMNVGFWQAHQETSLSDIQQRLEQSHKEVLALIDAFTEEELFQKAHFRWSGTTNLASYCISATSSHYDWAMKKLKRQVKLLHKT